MPSNLKNLSYGLLSVELMWKTRILTQHKNQTNPVFSASYGQKTPGESQTVRSVPLPDQSALKIPTTRTDPLTSSKRTTTRSPRRNMRHSLMEEQAPTRTRPLRTRRLVVVNKARLARGMSNSQNSRLQGSEQRRRSASWARLSVQRKQKKLPRKRNLRRRQRLSSCLLAMTKLVELLLFADFYV